MVDRQTVRRTLPSIELKAGLKPSRSSKCQCSCVVMCGKDPAALKLNKKSDSEARKRRRSVMLKHLNSEWTDWKENRLHKLPLLLPKLWTYCRCDMWNNKHRLHWSAGLTGSWLWFQLSSLSDWTSLKPFTPVYVHFGNTLLLTLCVSDITVKVWISGWCWSALTHCLWLIVRLK